MFAVVCAKNGETWVKEWFMNEIYESKDCFNPENNGDYA